MSYNYNVHLITKETNLNIPSEVDKDHPKLSIVIPVYNGGKNIRNVLFNHEIQSHNQANQRYEQNNRIQSSLSNYQNFKTRNVFNKKYKILRIISKQTAANFFTSITK